MLTADMGGILVGGGSRNPVGEQMEYKWEVRGVECIRP